MIQISKRSVPLAIKHGIPENPSFSLKIFPAINLHSPPFIREFPPYVPIVSMTFSYGFPTFLAIGHPEILSNGSKDTEVQTPGPSMRPAALEVLTTS